MADPLSKLDAGKLQTLFGEPPEKVIAFLKAKKLVPTDSWRDLEGWAHNTSFTVARSAGFDILADIKAALLQAIEKGQSYKDFLAQLKPILIRKGWWGEAVDKETGEIIKSYEGSTVPVRYGTPRRLRTIFRTNLQTAFSAGRYQALKEATDSHPYWQYVAVLDNRTRASHRAMHGRVFRHDDPAWQVAAPPNGFNCRCRLRPISEPTLKREGLGVSTAEGKVVTLSVPRLKGAPIQVQALDLPSLERPFAPDPGWDYAPGGEPKA